MFSVHVVWLSGYAKNLKARFKELQEQQKSADYVEHRPSGVANKVICGAYAIETSNRLAKARGH